MAVDNNKLRDQKKKENEAELMSGRFEEKIKLRNQRKRKMNLSQDGLWRRRSSDIRRKKKINLSLICITNSIF